MAGLNSLGFYFLAGVSAWFVYLLPELEGAALSFGIIIAIWQDILMWKQKII